MNKSILSLLQIQRFYEHCKNTIISLRDGRFDSKVGQIGPQIGQIRGPLTHFGVKPTIPDLS